MNDLIFEIFKLFFIVRLQTGFDRRRFFEKILESVLLERSEVCLTCMFIIDWISVFH